MTFSRLNSVSFIDLEASGLDGYPIEIGYATISRDGNIQSGARLIYHPPWAMTADRWDPAAELIHGISMEDLKENGISPRNAMDWINRKLIEQSEAYCNGGAHDQWWLRDLSEASGLLPCFKLEDITKVYHLPEVNERGADKAIRMMDRTTRPHRAEADAVRLAKAFSLAVGWPAVQRLAT